MKILRLAVLILAMAVSPSAQTSNNNPNYKDPATPIALPEIEAPRALSLTTDLSAGGFIFSPAEPDYKDIAVSLRAALEKRTRADFSIITTLAELKEQPVGKPGIVLGQALNCPLMGRLYWNGYTQVTPTYPGREGFVVETVHQPLPLLPAANVVVLGASHPAENKKAAEFFLKDVLARTHGPRLPVLLEVRPRPEIKKLKGGGNTLQSFRHYCAQYHNTADPESLRLALETLDQAETAFTKEPDWVLVWGDEINSYLVAQSWDFFAEHALAAKVLSEADFLRYERLFLKLINKLIPKSEVFDIIKRGQSTLAWNHSSIPLLGIYTLGRYFTSHYPRAAKQLQVCVDRPTWYFMGQVPNYRMSEDAQGYQTFSLRFVLAYYLMTGEMAYFENGNVRKMVRLALAQVDNNGHFVGSGDAGGPFTGLDDATWPMVTFVHEVPELYWFASLPQNRYVRGELKLSDPFRPETAPRPPDDLLGVVAIPFDKGMYDYLRTSNVFRMMGPGYVPFVPPAYPLERSFDKLQFRSVTETGGEYLLVDGFSRGNHNHFDTNAIAAATLEGYRFLFDADYLVARSADHTMLNVVKDGRTLDPVPGVAGIYGLADFPAEGYSCTGVKNYNGVEWKRHIYWRKNGYFLVVDTALAEQSGQYGFDNVWKVFDRGLENFDGRDLTCRAPNPDRPELNPITAYPPRTFRLRSADAENNWWNHRLETRYLIPSHRLHQNKFLAMDPGDLVSYQNTFYVERPEASGRVIQYLPRRLNAKALVIEAGPERFLALIEDGEYRDAKLRGLFVLLGGGRLFAVNARSFMYRDKPVFEATSEISLSFEGGRLLIKAEKPGRLGLHLAGAPRVLDYPAGVSEPSIAGGVLPSALVEAIARLTPQGEGDKAPASPASEAMAWSPDYLSPAADSKSGDGTDLATGLLSKEAGPVALTAVKNSLICRDARGRERWRFDHQNRILSCALMLRPGERAATILAGSDKRELIALDAAGRKLKQVTVTAYDSAHFGIHDDKPWINSITVHDLDKDGDPEIFLGLESWQIQMYDHDLNYLWHNAMILHGTRDVAFADVDNDGREEIIVGDRYGLVSYLDPRKDGKYSWRETMTAIGDVTIASLDIDGDMLPELVNCSDAGKLTVFKRRAPETNDYEPVWRFDNFGFGHLDVEVLTGRSPLILVASESGYLYYLDSGDGRVRHQVYLDRPVTVLLALPSGQVLAGTEAGRVFRLNGEGEILGAAELSSKIVRLRAMPDGRAAVLDDRGRLAILEAATF